MSESLDKRSYPLEGSSTVGSYLVENPSYVLSWDATTESLPQSVLDQAEDHRLLKRLYYPYVQLSVRAEVKSPLLPSRELKISPSVDAVTAGPCMVLAGVSPEPVDDPSVPVYIVPSAVSTNDIHSGRVYQAIRTIINKRVRSWSNLNLNIENHRLVHKRIDLYSFSLTQGSEATLALDTVSGECGMVR